MRETSPGEIIDVIMRDVMLTEKEGERFAGKTFDEMKDLKHGLTMVEGLVSNFGFHTARLKGHETAIRDLAWSVIPDVFYPESGGGMSFLNFVMDRDGEIWTSFHQTAEHFCCLLIGLDLGQWLPGTDMRDVWSSLPGGMPYFGMKVGRDDLVRSDDPAGPQLDADRPDASTTTPAEG